MLGWETRGCSCEETKHGLEGRTPTHALAYKTNERAKDPGHRPVENSCRDCNSSGADMLGKVQEGATHSAG